MTPPPSTYGLVLLIMCPLWSIRFYRTDTLWSGALKKPYPFPPLWSHPAAPQLTKANWTILPRRTLLSKLRHGSVKIPRTRLDLKCRNSEDQTSNSNWPYQLRLHASHAESPPLDSVCRTELFIYM